MYPPTSTRLFSFYCYGAHRDLHSFPTRRSSDLGAAAARSRRLLAFTHPPDRWYLRGGFSVVNFFLWLGRSAFRIFVHPPQQMAAVLEAAGFVRAAHRESFLWSFSLYRRPQVSAA